LASGISLVPAQTIVERKEKGDREKLGKHFCVFRVTAAQPPSIHPTRMLRSSVWYKYKYMGNEPRVYNAHDKVKTLKPQSKNSPMRRKREMLKWTNVELTALALSIGTWVDNAGG